MTEICSGSCWFRPSGTPPTTRPYTKLKALSRRLVYPCSKHIRLVAETARTVATNEDRVSRTVGLATVVNLAHQQATPYTSHEHCTERRDRNSRVGPLAICKDLSHSCGFQLDTHMQFSSCYFKYTVYIKPKTTLTL